LHKDRPCGAHCLEPRFSMAAREDPIDGVDAAFELLGDDLLSAVNR
jgi:hypothetical protein